MNFLVTYSDDSMDISKSRCVNSALMNGVDITIPFDATAIDGGFHRNNKTILDATRGVGLWLWKPYVINKLMNETTDGHIIIYSDAGIEFINNVSHIIEKMDEDIFFFSNGHKQIEWCKMDVMAGILPKEHFRYSEGANGLEVYCDAKQVQASVIFFKVNQRTRDFVKEWLLWCQMPGFIDDSPSKIPNYPTFAEHRHDQAILCALQLKYGYKIHWWPAKYEGGFTFENNGFTDSYPPIFLHHRKRNSEYQNLQTA